MKGSKTVCISKNKRICTPSNTPNAILHQLLISIPLNPRELPLLKAVKEQPRAGRKKPSPWPPSLLPSFFALVPVPRIAKEEESLGQERGRMKRARLGSLRSQELGSLSISYVSSRPCSHLISRTSSVYPVGRRSIVHSSPTIVTQTRKIDAFAIPATRYFHSSTHQVKSYNRFWLSNKNCNWALELKDG